MSSRVAPSEYPSLMYVPARNWSFGGRPMNIGFCDLGFSHGRAHHWLQTTDHRTLAACSTCFREQILPAAPKLKGVYEAMFGKQAKPNAQAIIPPVHHGPPPNQSFTEWIEKEDS